ncbi:hypothetical protein V1514DRAFT_333067 [Lipomyces japonicus]|uniref:uncharacterized protein n=1 Tax=Lipomyces japonicus TaxID=56871 RepID=UPI0034CEDB54
MDEKDCTIYSPSHISSIQLRQQHIVKLLVHYLFLAQFALITCASREFSRASQGSGSIHYAKLNDCQSNEPDLKGL